MRKRIAELDSLRGIAALSVVFFHYNYDSHVLGAPNIPAMGIDLFFMISGFVIFMTLDHSNSPVDFLVKRFSRLYPAYWFSVTFTVILYVLNTKWIHLAHWEYPYGPGDSLRKLYAENMTMFQYFFGKVDIDDPYWTLAVELCFYIFVLIFAIFRAVPFIELAGFVLLLFSASYGVDSINGNPIMNRIVASFPLLSYFPLFYAGILAYKMKFERMSLIRMFVFASTLIIQCFIFKNRYHNNWILNITCYSITLTGIYLIMVLFLADKLGFIVNTYTLWLGKISYCLYLIHNFIGTSFLIPFFVNKVHLNPKLASVIAFIIVLGVAHLISRYIEVPSMNFIRAIYNRHKLKNQPA